MVNMPSFEQFPRVDCSDIKSQLCKKLGRQRTERYFYYLTRLLSHKLSKLQFDRLCCITIGKENVALHNLFIKSILSNSFVGAGTPNKQAATGNSRTSRTPSGQFKDTLMSPSRRRRLIAGRDRKYGDSPSPLGPFGKVHPGQLQEGNNSCDFQRSRDQPSAMEFRSGGSRAAFEVVSVEDGEEVDQVKVIPCVQSRSPIRAPLGISKIANGALRARSHLSKLHGSGSCYGSSELPDTVCLHKQLEHKLESEGLGISIDCANLLNKGLDSYLRRLIKPCLELARARCSNRSGQASRKIMVGMDGKWHDNHATGTSQCCFASLQDLLVAMQSNPQLLGGDWPVKLEKMCFRSYEE